MIYLTRLNGKDFYINAELIQLVEGVPDTIITLTNNTKYIVKEPADEVVEKIIHYKRRIYLSMPTTEQEVLASDLGE